MISTYKAALETVPELIRAYKQCTRDNKYGYEKCRETKAEYVYTCLAKHVSDAERNADANMTEREREQLRQEQIVKVDRCITERFVSRLALREVSVYVAYDRLPQATSQVLPVLMNVLTSTCHGHFEPAAYRPGRFIAKLRWSEDHKTLDLAAFASKFSYKAYGLPAAMLAPPNRVYGYSPIDSSVASLLANKYALTSRAVRPFCKLSVPQTVVLGRESIDKHSLKTFDGAKFEVTVPKQRLVVLAASCQQQNQPEQLFKPRDQSDDSAKTPVFVAVERLAENDRQVIIRVDDQVYRVDSQCKATASNLRNDVRRHLVASAADPEHELSLYRYEDGDCRINERSTGLEVLFDGHSVLVMVSPLRMGYATPLCGLCSDLNANFVSKEEIAEPIVRRHRAELAVARNCPAATYGQHEEQPVERYEDEDYEELLNERKSRRQAQDTSCELVQKTNVEIKRESNRICFTREAVPTCPNKCRAASTRPESVELTCLEDNVENRELARRLTLSHTGLNYGSARLYAHPVSITESRNLPTRCERI